MSGSESDPDFVNHQPFTYEKTRGRGRGKSNSQRGRASGRGRGRGHVGLGTYARTRAPGTANPLLAYFGQDASTSEPEQSSDEDEVEEEEEELVEDDDESVHSSEPRRSISPPILTPRVVKSPESDGSVTEPESDDMVEVVSKKRVNSDQHPNDRPSKRTKLYTSPTSYHKASKDSTTSRSRSQTAPDSDPEDGPSTKKQSRGDESDSKTESDSEFEGQFDTCNWKPAFAVPAGQTRLGPLVLDEEFGIAVPGSINTFLREYQRDGIRFLWNQWKRNLGGILGDDMGLGKTIQVISFLSAIMKKRGDERDVNRRRNYVADLQDGVDWQERRILPRANEKWPTCLIIAPSTVVHNWERELDTWGYFEVGVYTGNQDDRHDALTDFKMGRTDVVLTTFDIARKDINLLDDLAWSCIFIDEVHKVKNPQSKVTLAYNSFACQTRFGLTGTAIQNSYRELWTILDWACPGKLGTEKQWTEIITKPLAAGQSSSASEKEKKKASEVARVLVNKIMPSFFLRRTKDIIKDQLPTKTDEVVFCPLTDKQIHVYKCILGTPAVENMVRKDELCDCGSEKRRSQCHYKYDSSSVFHYMSILIKISNHLALILPSPTDSEEQTIRNRELAEIGWKGEPIPKYGPAMLLSKYCGKWDVLNQLLEEWHKNRKNKVLIFTKSVKLLDMLDHHLNLNGYTFCKLDGSTKQSDRMPLIDKFNQDPTVFVFLISTLAGGTGLNLTSANKVVIFDPNWNPAHDLQAMDRAYRFGQTRDVSVYRLLGAGSIEELIYARQVYKQQQMKIGYEASTQTRYFSGVQGDSRRQGELFGLKNIFKLHEDTLATKMAIEKANMAEFDWALAHMDGVNQGPRSEQADMRGLTSLVLDENLPTLEDKGSGVDEIQRILNEGGIKYTHRNDAVIRPNRIEEVLMKEETRKRRKSKGKTKTKDGSPEVWPPVRKHHSAPMTPSTKLELRHRALLESGMVKTADELPSFASKFAQFPVEEQQRILGELDKLAKRHSLAAKLSSQQDSQTQSQSQSQWQSQF